MTFEQQLILQAVLCLPGIIVCSRLLRRVRERGGQVSTDAFGLPDLLLAFFLCGFFALSTLASGLVPHAGPTAEVPAINREMVLVNVAMFLGFVVLICVSLALRKANPVTVFGLHRWPLWRAALTGLLIVLALFPLLGLVAAAIQRVLGEAANEQDLVVQIREIQRAGDTQMLAMIGVLAVVFQPIVEEVLFRGYFYGVFKGWAGAVASAMFTATLFAAIHLNLASLLPLLLLALALTLAYEWSGSLLVPISMHMAFNGVQLAFLFWAPHLIPAR